MKTVILYEDNDILVCHKPPMFPVQAKGAGAMDMESELKNYLKSSAGNGIPYLGIVHRLDQPVEGVIVFAKNKKAAAELSRQVQDDGVNGMKGMEKIYEAQIYGHIEPTSGELRDYLVKDSKTNTSRIALEKEIKSGEGKEALLEYELKKRCEDTDVLTVKLHTGRHHQIRVQLASKGFPLVGDLKYGDEQSIKYTKEKNIRAVCLKAVKLSFSHPKSHKYMTFGL